MPRPLVAAVLVAWSLVVLLAVPLIPELVEAVTRLP